MKYKKSLFYLIAFLVLCPLIALGVKSFDVESNVFSFLISNVLDDVILNTLFVLGLTSFGVLIIGLSCAWFVVNYSFFGRRALQWLLFMPLSMPAYILAYIYTDFFDVGGDLNRTLKEFGLSIFVPDIRTIWGASFILTFCLYPYVYLFARNGFMLASKSQVEAGKILGAGRFSQFWDIALPSARPFIIVGLSLVAMEILADYGTMDYFGIKVFSTVIYDSWAGYGDVSVAARLSLILLVFVLLLVWSEKSQRGKMRFYVSESSRVYQTPQKKGFFFMSLWCAIPVTFGFVFPVFLLFSMAIGGVYDGNIVSKFFHMLPYVFNSIVICALVAGIGVTIAFFLSSFKRESKDRVIDVLYGLCGFGYALPGIILGLGLLLISSFFSEMGFLVTGTFVFLIAGYLIRFLNVALQSLDAGFEKISPSITQASHLMARNKFDDFWHIKRPLLMPSMLSAGLILAVEVIKELPLTLVLRPFDFDTLAVHTYTLASDERLSDAAFPAICIVLAGCIPVFLLQRLARRQS